MARRRYSKKNGMGFQGLLISGAAFAVIALVVAMFFGGIAFQSADSGLGGDSSESGVVITKEEGASSTIGINSFTGSWGEAGSKTEVYPTYTIFVDGNTKVNDAIANSTTGSVGDELDLYVTGSSYYAEPVLGFSIQGQSVNVPDVEAQTIVGTTDLVITAYDEDENALTADDNANNTADYNAGNVGTEEKTYFIKLKNNVKDETMRIGAILTYYCGDEADDFTLEEDGWETTSIPAGDLTKNFNMYDDVNASTSCSIKHAYVPSGSDYVELKEFDDTGKMKFVFDADDTTEPTANGDTYFGAVFVDFAYEQSEDGVVIGDWYKHDNSALPDSVGLNEAVTTSGFKGLDVGVAFEPQ